MVSSLTVLPRQGDALPIALRPFGPAVRHGVPGIEIIRAAENLGADLIVAGRCTVDGPGTPLGPTADLLSRRSRIPCLFLPPSQTGVRRIVAALDGTHRGLTVLRVARQLQTLVGVLLVPLTVEAELTAVSAAPVWTARTERLTELLREQAPVGRMLASLVVLRGNPVDEIVAGLAPEDVLAFGVHRGGPTGPPESSGVGHALSHMVPCGMLSVPL